MAISRHDVDRERRGLPLRAALPINSMPRRTASRCTPRANALSFIFFATDFGVRSSIPLGPRHGTGQRLPQRLETKGFVTRDRGLGVNLRRRLRMPVKGSSTDPTPRRTRASIAGAAACLLPLGLVCCGDRRVASELRSEEWDSAGIRILENARPPDGSRLGWRVDSARHQQRVGADVARVA